ncbi:MAG: helix-turn-helix domain-containing protein, partial [Chitinophagaceae bacterium]|nr:helix-turn-helix domain-containing protein [Chitinophagaceae bacterium]
RQCYSFSLLLRNVRRQRKKARVNIHLMNWLQFNVVMFGLFTMIGLLSYCFSLWIRYTLMTTLWQPLIMFSVLGIILLFNPEILYGTYDNDSAEPHTDETKRLVIDKVISLQVKDTLDEFIARRQYLRQNIRIKEVGEELGIQPYVLSAFINQLYQMRFNDYINKYRVEYIKDGLLNGEWSQLTLEAIAEEAGFTNRTTFLNAFKKFTGVTPTAFMQENKKPHSAKVASF